MGQFPFQWPGIEPLAASFVLYFVSFAILGLAFLLVARETAEGVVASYPVLAGSFALAWVAGFVVPGSPGGIGVREAVLVTALAPLLGAGAALGLAVLFRVVAIAGDAVAFALGLLGGAEPGYT